MSRNTAELETVATEMPPIFMDSRSYYKELLSEVPKVKARALMMAMAYWSDEAGVTDKVIDVLGVAAENGARVTLAVDTFSKLQYDHLPLWMLTGQKASKGRQQAERTQSKIEELEKSGGTFVWLNEQGFVKKTLFFTNTNHIKVTIIDDTVYLGGANITDNDLDKSLDFMVRIENPELADLLENILFENSDATDEDAVIEVDGLGQIYIDAGKARTSIIYDTATKLITEAEDSVAVISRFAPTGRFREAVQTADHNGAEVDYVYLPIEKLTLLYKGLGSLGVWQSRHLPLRAQSHQSIESFGPLHAKLIIADDALMITSHNFSAAGVVAKTKELAVVTKEKRIIDQVKRLIAICLA